jgi:hypothetical protein
MCGRKVIKIELITLAPDQRNDDRAVAADPVGHEVRLEAVEVDLPQVDLPGGPLPDVHQRPWVGHFFIENYNINTRSMF